MLLVWGVIWHMAVRPGLWKQIMKWSWIALNWVRLNDVWSEADWKKSKKHGELLGLETVSLTIKKSTVGWNGLDILNVKIIMSDWVKCCMTCPKTWWDCVMNDMDSLGINGEEELKGQPANPGSPGEMAIKMECMYISTVSNDSLLGWSHCWVLKTKSIITHSLVCYTESVQPGCTPLFPGLCVEYNCLDQTKGAWPTASKRSNNC